MENTPPKEIQASFNNLFDNIFCLFFRKPSIFFDILRKIPTFTILGDDIVIIFSFVRVIEFDNIGMAELFTDFNLLFKHLNILEFFKVYHLYCVFFLIVLMDVIGFIDRTAEPLSNHILFPKFICPHSDELSVSVGVMRDIGDTFFGGDSPECAR